MAACKMKTKRAAAKRYRVTGKGRIKTGRKGKRHIFTNKSRKRKRNLRGSMLLGPSDEAMAKSLLPYG
ncbi:MAG: 50S ribosomal protein L35 [Deltaproteobacteria bacterium]|jgi:large subunit ribosomal protein L35|nr:MAG: 50S ribosomal protein L35 [Deltaproteobacteria bacterium]